MNSPISSRKPLKWAALSCVLLALASCEDAEGFEFLKKKEKTEPAQTAEQNGEAPEQFIERDVESPEIFDVTGKALWDGRPSLGGVWVAHSDVAEPERVVIRNAANGKKVIGALFRRERDSAGPPLQISSDTADALGIVAGVPVELSVIAMRKKKIPVNVPEPDEPATTAADPEALDATALEPIATSGNVAAEPLTAPVETAGTTTARPMIKPLPRPTSGLVKAKKTVAASAPKPAAAPSASGSKRYVQMGFFSVESNANATLTKLRNQGVSGTIIASESNGTKFWRVLAGPSSTSEGAESILDKVKAMGFADAFIVKG